MDDLDLLFSRMNNASEQALDEIHNDILCQIKVDPLGLVIDTSHGSGDERLSIRKFIGYPDLKLFSVDILGMTLRSTLEALKNEIHNGRD